MSEPRAVPPASEAAHVTEVRRYYDANTSLFVRFGQGQGSIHRAVWGPGAGSRHDAMHWVDEQVATELARMPDAQLVLDLGCGVGASLLHVASRTRVRGVGVTLSPVQCERANQAFREAGLAGRLSARVGDFHELDGDLVNVDVAFAIEAFVQAASAERFFASAGRALRPGGRLLVCDDVVARPARSAAEARYVEDFRKGWRIGALLAVPDIAGLAERAGLTLVSDTDLTPYLELRRPRDVAIGLAVKLGRVFGAERPYLASLIGGDALQRALGAGVLAYRLLVFEARGSASQSATEPASRR